MRSLISTVHIFSGSARICSAILWVMALSSVSCAAYPKIPVAADVPDELFGGDEAIKLYLERNEFDRPARTLPINGNSFTSWE